MTDLASASGRSKRSWTALLPAGGIRIPYWVRRLLQAVPVIFLVITINFFLLRLAPGDIADVMAGEAGAYSAEFTERLRQEFGLDQPLAVQYFTYVAKVLQLDLGWSHRYGLPVFSLVLERLSATAILVITAVLVAAFFGSLLGMIAGLTRSRVIDAAISIVSTAGFATPLFWLGLMLVVVFSVYLQLLPSSGMQSLGESLEGWAVVRDRAAHLVLPVTCLSAYYLAIYARLMRTTVIELKHQDFVRTARAKGASPLRTVLRHILPNAMLGIITLTGLQFGTLFSGSVTIEAVFGWPGLGQLALNAVSTRDYNLLLGILFVSSLFVLLVNIITDFSYAFFDPRVQVSK